MATNGTKVATMSQADIDRLIAENEALKEQLSKKTPLGLKVGSKGTVSLSGINGPRPVSLYAEQWHRVIDFAPVIEQFIVDNAHMLSDKLDTPAEAAAKLAARDAAGIDRPEVAAAKWEAKQSGQPVATAPLVQGSAASRRPGRLQRK